MTTPTSDAEPLAPDLPAFGFRVPGSGFRVPASVAFTSWIPPELAVR